MYIVSSLTSPMISRMFQKKSGKVIELSGKYLMKVANFLKKKFVKVRELSGKYLMKVANF